MESNGGGWLADSLLAVDNNVKHLMKMIEDVDIQIGSEDSETKDHKRSVLATYVDEFHSQYHKLAMKYYQLAKEQGRNVQELDDNSVSSFYTPLSKFTEHKPELQAVGSEDIGSSDLSYKNSYGSSSNSLTDSGSENSSREVITIDSVSDGEKKAVQNVKENDLLKRIEECEIELQVANAKFKSSADEANKFKSKLRENEVVVKQLSEELDAARALVKSQDAFTNMEKSKVSELEERILSNEDEFSEYRKQVQRLGEALAEAQNELLLKDAHYQSEMFSLLEQRNSVEKLVEEKQLQINSLENETSELKNEILKMKSAHDAKEAVWENELNSLKAENMAKADSEETLCKFVDTLKLKYDMANARLETLTAELSHKNDVIQQLNVQINDLNSLNTNLNADIHRLKVDVDGVRQLETNASNTQRELFQTIDKSNELNICVDELRLRVNDLDRELEEQRDLVAEGAELKREAIRQLCMSLEYFRAEYLELREAVVGKKRHMPKDVGSHS